MNKQLCLLSSVLLVGILLLGAGCGGDPNVEGAKLALTLEDVDYDDYLQKLDESIAADPTNAEAFLVKGKLLQKQASEVRDADQHIGLVNRMVEAYNGALALQPDNAEALQKLREAYVGEFQLGIQAFNRGREDEAAYEEAVKFFQSTSFIQPDSSGPYVNQAYALINAGRQDDAVTPFEMAIEKGEREADTYLLLSNIYQSKDELGKAIALLEESRELFPEREDLQSQLLNAYIADGQMDRAMQDYAAAVEREPDNKLYRYNFGTLLLEAEKYDESAEQFAAAIDIDPTYGVAHYNLGASYVNKAVEINEEITVIDDELRANRSDYSSDQIKEAEGKLDMLTEERKSYFQRAITPLEEARKLFEAAGDDASGVCTALFQSYVQTGDDDNAEGAAACAGIDLN
ncbi:MAG: hypothetical protein AAF564_17125 [Bacteroidota bacterium]